MMINHPLSSSIIIHNLPSPGSCRMAIFCSSVRAASARARRPAPAKPRAAPRSKQAPRREAWPSSGGTFPGATWTHGVDHFGGVQAVEGNHGFLTCFDPANL